MQSDIAETIGSIRLLHRQRMFAMGQRQRIDLALGAYLRRALNWSKALPKSERDAIAEHALDLMEAGEAVVRVRNLEGQIKMTGGEKNALRHAMRKASRVTDDPVYVGLASIIETTVAARAPFDRIEDDATKAMEKLAETLPVWLEFGAGVLGFSSRGLGMIVGEAGDLSAYSSYSKLWKRMGLAVIDGRRQGNPGEKASKEDWIAHGYNAVRRSRMCVIADTIVKQGDDYRTLYLARKAYETAKAEQAGKQVVPAAMIKKVGDERFMSLGHVDKRASRYMQKRLLRDLWRAWRRAPNTVPNKALAILPSSPHSQDKAA